MSSSLILLSGGLDSAVLLAECAGAGRAGRAVAFRYGQRHARELTAAALLADLYQVPLEVIDLTAWGRRLAGSALTDPDVEVPAGHYTDPAQETTIVPNRNATLLSAAAGLADTHGHDAVLTAVHAGDGPVYPDCRPEFVAAIDRATRLATDGRVGVRAPFLPHTKADIAVLAGVLDVPIALTWSCYRGGDAHCGTCGACVERREALAAAGGDPTVYEEPAPCP